MITFLAALGSILWVVFIGFLLYLRQTPAARVRKRMKLMIDRAEAERARVKRIQEAAETKVVVKKVSLHRSFYRRVIRPILIAIAHRLHQLTPPAIIEMLERKIFLAGKQGVWNVQSLAAVWLLSIAAGAVGGIFVAQRTDYFIGHQVLIVAGAG